MLKSMPRLTKIRVEDSLKNESQTGRTFSKYWILILSHKYSHFQTAIPLRTWAVKRVGYYLTAKDRCLTQYTFPFTLLCDST